MNLLVLVIKKTLKYIFSCFELEVIPDNWTQKFEPDGGQISKP